MYRASLCIMFTDLRNVQARKGSMQFSNRTGSANRWQLSGRRGIGPPPLMSTTFDTILDLSAATTEQNDDLENFEI